MALEASRLNFERGTACVAAKWDGCRKVVHVAITIQNGILIFYTGMPGKEMK
jgi:hypothetical protein